ncbi:A24 family peptidase [Thiotrichales bacterium 19X7-9]|nr:A24 family peptidase [Thiotrichales bacterium 19X7-9]
MTIILILSFIIGLSLGSFINVIAYRLPLKLQANWQKNCLNYLGVDEQTNTNANTNTPFNLFGLRSHCPYCHQTIRFYHNIPIISFLWLKGQCAYCQNKIAWIYPVTELVSAIMFVLIVMQFNLTLTTLFALIFVFSLITLAVIDIRTQLLPDSITLPLLWLGLAINSFSYFTSLTMAFWGAVIGYLILWFIYIIYKLLRHTDGLGFGDFKCLSAIGAWLGINALLPVLLIASISALITISIIRLSLMITTKNHRPKTQSSDRIAFGPFLAFASIVVLFWHNSALLLNISITSIM